MLLLAVHSLSESSAKVPFAMVALLDAVKRKEVPAELKCRQVFPTNGTKSTSLWDAKDKTVLQEWLDEFLDAECNSEVFEVQEEFAFGVSSELARMRATERVTDSTRATAQAVQERTQKAAAGVSQTVGDIDSRLKVSESAAAALKSARESQMAKKTSEVLGGVSRQAQTLSKQALEDKRVAAVNANISAGWTKLSTAFGFAGRIAPTAPPSGPTSNASAQTPASAPIPSATRGEPKVTEAKNGPTATTANRRTKIDDAFTLDDAEAEEAAKLRR